MSEFDKEAEREKLREKYEHEEQKREATEQMSELLLKGATMTNAHCSDCGDPIFRYDGQEFCPTCEPSTDTRVAFGGDADQAEAGQGGQQDEEAARSRDERPQQSQANRQPQQNQANRRGQQPTPSRQQGNSAPQPSRTTGGDGVAAARESLVAALARFSEQAAATDDPRRARDHLAAAREAAEALDALDR
ncbi:MAG: hypothetical protein BRD21_01385 [Halobacteriales archaeon SW_8_66_22]|nr:MAG: hypothetical protein BRD21_01385 [Halobacteriales archaeon SW_8_66_22]